ncbi:MAG: outer membrane lipoprotein-sorting protein, partial [Candidatus Calescibacterium sp.]|nr:outer membrane lipoprotein-sorting protein [Candidatus Calescibacterium sp.]
FKEDFIKPLKVDPDNRYPLITSFPFLYLLRYEEMEKVLYPVVVAYEDIGSGELKGRKVAVISVIDKTKMYERYRVYIDTQNYFPVKTVFYPFEKDKNGIEVIYKGFSYVADGRVWAKKVMIYYFNQKSKYLAWVLYLNNISINIGLIDDLFQTGLDDLKDLPDVPK